ncbi:hypothetical protein ESCO_004975 [Escovopsis weberi]|uniref:NIMA interactive protein n=1 Tax=Escovopsis weberi TaxID=150374 RepID=A0A0M8N247_ESCWE|nr:hypothetical protein ESCO_004975 [Escovopsis weberi]
MIDSGNLHAASLYINNQLLSRGLLRDGQAIDFTMLGYGHGGSAETSRKIISVINDLILRRDRDAEQRESLSTATRDLRDENLKYAGDVNRLTEKAAEAQRRFEIATASEASMRTQLKSAESALRSLKDELARTKALVAQARAACATEIKRRDRQMDTLKKQVGEAGRTRGAKGNAAVMTITVTGETGGEERGSNRSSRASAHDSLLRSETNSFLASVAQGLSEENESLLQTMQETMEQLREMSGWDGDEDADELVARQPGWEELSLELNAVMEHMRSILTNPSFVPIEEVLVREEEIDRLKAGWIKMESRWEDAVHLMDAWRKRMAVTGRPINEEDLKIGLSLSPVRVNSVEETRDARRPGLSEVKMEYHDGELRRDVRLVSNPGKGRHSSPPPEPYAIDDESEDSGSEFNGFDDEILLDEHGVQIIDQAIPETATHQQRPPSPDSPSLPEPPQLSPLKSVVSSAVNRRPQRVTVPPIKPNPHPSAAEEEGRHEEPEKSEPARPPQRCVKIPLRGVSHIRTKSSSSSSSKAPIFPSDNESSSRGSATAPTSRRKEEPHPHDHAARDPSHGQVSRRGTRARGARPNTDSETPSEAAEPPSLTTIAAKLAASEKEADAARARAKLRSAARAAATKSSDTSVSAAARAPREPGRVRRREDMDPVKRDPARADEQKMEKRRTERRASKTLSRRRSTLNRLELETLIVGNAQ